MNHQVLSYLKKFTTTCKVDCTYITHAHNVLCIMIDFSKAFDRVDHPTLLAIEWH